jgi:hypothetical protein
VTISVRGVGSSCSERSRTCTSHPARANKDAVRNPAADPPTIVTWRLDLLPFPASISRCSLTIPHFNVTFHGRSELTWNQFRNHLADANNRGEPPAGHPGLAGMNSIDPDLVAVPCGSAYTITLKASSESWTPADFGFGRYLVRHSFIDPKYTRPAV